MKLNVENYKPEEISVKLDGRNLEIHAKHEEMEDEHGFIARQFTRRVLLPEVSRLFVLFIKVTIHRIS